MKHCYGFCLLCHNFHELYNYICPLCRAAVEALLYQGENCALCGQPLLHKDSICLCDQTGPFIQRIAVYAKDMQHLMLRYKKTGVKRLGYFLANLITHYVPEDLHLVIVPVPCSRSSRKTRGWDQMAYIAKIIGRTTDHTVCKLLERTGNSEQKGLSRSQRLAEAPRSYFLNERQWHLHAQKIEACHAIVVIDDVMTTGSTLRTCIAKIEEVIAKPIVGLCLAMD